MIRYWETQFSALRPARRESGQRKFTQKEVDTILRIKELLYDKRFTIAGAKQYLKLETRRGTAQLRLDLEDTPSASQTFDSPSAPYAKTSKKPSKSSRLKRWAHH